MASAHKIDALVCISNCDKITPGMLMAAMRLNIPAVFVSGGPMEAGRLGDRAYDLIDVMVKGADKDFSDDDLSEASEVFYNLEVYSGDEETVKELLYTIKLEKLNMRINAETDPTNLMDLFKQREELLNEKNTWEE